MLEYGSFANLRHEAGCFPIAFLRNLLFYGIGRLPQKSKAFSGYALSSLLKVPESSINDCGAEIDIGT